MLPIACNQLKSAMALILTTVAAQTRLMPVAAVLNQAAQMELITIDAKDCKDTDCANDPACN